MHQLCGHFALHLVSQLFVNDAHALLFGVAKYI